MEKSLVTKRSIVVGGHKTSVSVEEAFWDGLRNIADEHEMTLSALVGKIDGERQFANLSSAIRLFVLGSYQKQVSEISAGTTPLEPRQKSIWRPRWQQYDRLRALRGIAR